MTLRDQLRRDEGLRLTAYTDTAGNLTLGYGHNLAKPIPREIADALLDADIADARADLLRHLPWSGALGEARQDVLVNMIFNMGSGGLLGFRRMLAALQAGDFNLAAEEMLTSTWAAQVGDRATRLAEQMWSGVEQ